MSELPLSGCANRLQAKREQLKKFQRLLPEKPRTESGLDCLIRDALYASDIGNGQKKPLSPTRAGRNAIERQKVR